ncbi:MAG TPA: tRNA (N(6)-L-threonylcarbamoyladenosine(37)-C(2))-methylthiotransferase MtaB [Pirellulales bacterium]|jgi:threonylcarbamoyladenosine tRNA methylthiotransferase MtaB
MPTLRTATLGCKVNQYETQYVREGLQGIGYREANGDEPADLCIVNTCTVTAEGDAKSRQIIRQLARRNPGTRIVVMGCYATRAPEEVASLPAVSEVLTDKRELPDLLGRFGIVDVPTGISGLDGRQRAYVKVQDGCLLNCTFCIIPKVRPELASRPPEQIVAEIERLIGNGYREVVLTGIHLGHYGIEHNRGRPKDQWLRLSHLLERIIRLPGDFRVRLSSIEATEITRELIRVMADHPDRICPHLHVSMQSGSDRILRRMHRRWGARRLVDRCLLVRESLAQPALTTDVIVGFPGETDADFADTCSVLEEIGCSKIHIFPFSARRTTPAAEMSDQVAPAVKAARANELSVHADRLRDRYYHSLRGRSLQVLVEPRAAARPGFRLGTSCRYAPVEVPIEGTRVRDFVTVIAGDVVDGCIRTHDHRPGRT